MEDMDFEAQQSYMAELLVTLKSWQDSFTELYEYIGELKLGVERWISSAVNKGKHVHITDSTCKSQLESYHS